MAEPSPATDGRLPGATSAMIAWSGGLAFVVSLIAFLYCYGFTFTSAGDGAPVAVPAAIDIALFSVFALHHSLFARTHLKDVVSRLVPCWLERSIYTWVASLLFLVVCLEWRRLPGTLYDLRGLSRLTAYAIQLVGLVLTARGSAAIDVLDLAGIRQVLNARDRTPPRHVPLETSGVYRLVRHPLYFGWAVFVFAAPTMTATRGLFALVSTAYLMVAIPWEERSLLSVFGDEYRAYQRRTRWRMIPGIY